MIFQDLIDLTRKKPYNGFDKLLDHMDKSNPIGSESNAFMGLIYFRALFELQGHFKPFLVNVAQMVEFTYASIDVQNYSMQSLKLPFNNIFIDFNGTYYNDIFKSPLKGMMLDVGKNDSGKIIFFGIYGITKQSYDNFLDLYQNNNSLSAEQRFDQVDNIIQDAEVIGMYGNQLRTILEMEKERMPGAAQATLLKMALGFLFYVNAVNVEIIEVPGEDMQTKKRRQQNKAIPEPYYFCKLETKEVKVTDGEPGEGSKHSYQYDVRGHFRKITHWKGKVYNPPRILWVPPHRRGLSATVYRPKTYVLTH